MRFATLVSWLVTVSLGAFMLRTWLARGGLPRERAKAGGLPPQLIFGHATAAVTGLLTWAGFVASGKRPLAWAAVVILTVVVSLGVCTVTLWGPYPVRKPTERRPSPGGGGPAGTPGPGPPGQGQGRGQGQDAVVGSAASRAATGQGDRQPVFEVTDEMINRFLADPAPHGYPFRLDPAVLVPVAHGFLALTTYLLAVMSAVTW